MQAAQRNSACISDALTLGSVSLVASARRICPAQAERTAGVGCGVPPGIVTWPSALSTGSGTPGIPWLRAQATAARAAARLPGAALACVWVPPLRLGTVESSPDDPHAASASPVFRG